jgi:hypothetical protein
LVLSVTKHTKDIRWVGLKGLQALLGPTGTMDAPYGGDMYAKCRGSLYSVAWSIPDGWVIHTPRDKTWAFDGTRWISGPSCAPPRGKVNTASLEQARLFAEELISVEGNLP